MSLGFGLREGGRGREAGHVFGLYPLLEDDWVEKAAHTESGITIPFNSPSSCHLLCSQRDGWHPAFQQNEEEAFLHDPELAEALERSRSRNVPGLKAVSQSNVMGSLISLVAWYIPAV